MVGIIQLVLKWIADNPTSAQEIASKWKASQQNFGRTTRAAVRTLRQLLPDDADLGTDDELAALIQANDTQDFC